MMHVHMRLFIWDIQCNLRNAFFPLSTQVNVFQVVMYIFLCL